MSVEIERSKDNETIVEYVNIDVELPSKEQIEGITQIGTLTIENIDDARKMQELLSKLSIDTVRRLQIMSCNLEGMDLQFLRKFRAMTEIILWRNSGINYDEVLELLPNKEQIKALDLRTDKEKRRIDIKRLKEFRSLSFLSLADFHNTDMETLHSYLKGAQALEQFVFAGNIESLDFISGVDLEHITIIDEDLDLSLITPEVVKKHKNLSYGSEKEKIDTMATNDENGYVVEPKVEYKKIEELKKWIEETKCSTVRATIIVHDREQLQELIKEKLPLQELTIQVPHTGIIDFHELEKLEQDNNLRYVIVRDQGEVGYGGQYSTEQYRVLKNKIQEIVGDIPENFTELQKFMIIYKRLGSKIIYDFDAVDRNAFNLAGALINGKSVCAGYAEALYNGLKEIDMETLIVGRNGHAWNKVQIDGVWYNVDLTWDCEDIAQHNERGLEFCLRSDEEFKEGHEQTDGKKVECNTDYSREEIVKAMRSAERFDDRALDTEYEPVTEKTDFFDTLKAKAMTLFGKRKMLEVPQTEVPVVKSEAERREEWLRKDGIVLDNGTELSRIDMIELSTVFKPKTKDREPEDD